MADGSWGETGPFPSLPICSLPAPILLLAPSARHLCSTKQKKIFQLRQERHKVRFPEDVTPTGF